MTTPLQMLAEINAVCSFQLPPRELHEFDLLRMSHKAVTCTKADPAWQMARGNPLLLRELVAHSSCPCSRAAQELGLPQSFGGRWEGAEKKKEGR